MRLLRNANPQQKRAKTHAYHLGKAMCGWQGFFTEVAGEKPTCKRCLIQLAVISRCGHRKEP